MLEDVLNRWFIFFQVLDSGWSESMHVLTLHIQCVSQSRNHPKQSLFHAQNDTRK